MKTTDVVIGVSTSLSGWGRGSGPAPPCSGRELRRDRWTKSEEILDRRAHGRLAAQFGKETVGALHEEMRPLPGRHGAGPVGQAYGATVVAGDVFQLCADEDDQRLCGTLAVALEVVLGTAECCRGLVQRACGDAHLKRPLAAAAFGEPAGTAAWRDQPVWGIVASSDKAINPDVQRFGYERAQAKVTEVDSSHLVMHAHPTEVVNVIREALASVTV